MHRLLGLVVLALMVTACQPVLHGRSRYVPPVVQIDARKPLLMQAVQVTARRQGWSVLVAHHRLGLVEALSPVDIMGSMRTRERWRFVIDNRRVTVELRFEAQMGAGAPWESAAEVCSDYGYVRERLYLAKVESYVRAQRRRDS